jgi:hypothetical protein
MSEADIPSVPFGVSLPLGGNCCSRPGAVGLRSISDGTLLPPGALCEKAGVAARPTPKITAAVKADFFFPMLIASFELNDFLNVAPVTQFRNPYASMVENAHG